MNKSDIRTILVVLVALAAWEFFVRERVRGVV